MNLNLSLNFVLKSNTQLKEIAKNLGIPQEHLIFRMTDDVLDSTHAGISTFLLDGTLGCFVFDKHHLAISYSMSDGRLISNYISIFTWSGGLWNTNGFFAGKRFRKFDKKQAKYCSSKLKTIMKKLISFSDMKLVLEYISSIQGTF